MILVSVNLNNQTSNSKVTNSGSSLNAASTINSASLVFEVDFKVTSDDYPNQISSKVLLPWDAIVEPHKDQYLSVVGMSLNGQKLENIVINWNIMGQSYTGTTIKVNLPKTGVYSSIMNIKLSSGESLTRKFNLAVKYVRREIRALSPSDEKKFYSTLKTIYSLSSADGKVKYGPKYNDITYFLYKHLNGAGRTDCDHWHDGAGIVTHHAAFTLEFEQAMQAVEPSVSMPYYEYGMDSYLYTDLRQNPIFSKDKLGDVCSLNSEHTIKDGSFWETVKIPSAASYQEWDVAAEKSLNPFTNAFGVMRSSWNNNPTEYIGRYNYSFGSNMPFPTCSTLKGGFKVSSMASMNNILNGGAHGPVHIHIGGAWDESPLFSLNSKTLSFLLGPSKLLFFKVLWRLGYTRCPTSCSGGKANCLCSVPDEYIHSIGAYKMLSDAGVIATYSKNIPDTTTPEQYLLILRALEDPGVAGEMFTSAAPFDPSFWPLHGSIERLLGYKLSLIHQGYYQDFDLSWGYPAYDASSSGAYLSGYCDWSKVKDPTDLTLPTCDFSAECSGHQENDLLEFQDFLGQGETYTNMEFFKFIDPWNDQLPYTYDSLDFDYCKEYGIDFLA
eukprot:gene4340-6143_t